jgi:hypothetical protein
MAAFPSLPPSAAPITPGAWPVSAHNSLNGAESRIRQGSAQIGRRLQLTFTNITEANFLAILAHYQGQRSGFDSFGFSTTTLAADLTPSGHAWLYASRPQVVDEHLDVFTVVCEFKSEPRGLVVAMGKAWRTGATVLSPGMGRDPSFSSVSLLLHMNGSNGSTTFTDSSSNGLAVTAAGNAAISTAQSRFGGASGAFDGNGDYLNLSSNAAFNYGTGDFTVEFWYRSSAAPSLSPFRRILAHPSSDNAVNTFQIWHAGTTAFGATIDAVELAAPDGTAIVCGVQAAVSDSAWHHIAFARQAGTTRAFLDGVLKQSAADANNYSRGGTEGVRVGSRGDLAASTFVNGFIDELRITKGIARYTASFAPPTAQFPDY